MTNNMVSENTERDIVALNYLTKAQLEARFALVSDTLPPQPMSRALLITAVTYETLRKSHRERIRHVA